MSARALASSSAAYRQAVQDIRPNPGQWDAFNAQDHCVVLAGPGSGKTKTLTVRMARLLIEDIRTPRGLACLTYNSECARELAVRLERLGVYPTEQVFVGTVHSFCLTRVLLPYASLAGVHLPQPLRIALSSEQEGLFARAVALEINADEPPWRWRTSTQEYRRTHLDRQSPAWGEDERLAGLVTRYERLLRAQGMIDFDDMILIGLAIIESNAWVRRALNAKFSALLVDEYQDLGVALHRIVLNLCFNGTSRLFGVGDPDQSIYGFTGARPHLLTDLAASGRVQTVRLPFNYRSGPTIVRAAEIALGEHRGYEARGPAGGIVDFHEIPEGVAAQAEYICTNLIPAARGRLKNLRLGDIAILYLDRNDGDVIAAAASEHGFATIRIDRGAPYAKTPLTRWLEDCAAWCCGGWQTGRPRLSLLLDAWAALATHRRSSNDARAQFERTRLVRFLMAHRSGHTPLNEWATTFRDDCLGLVLDADVTLRDEREALSTLITACAANGPIPEWTVAMFAGQGGSPEHLNLITLHSAKGLEFRVVVIMGLEQGRLPRYNASDIERREQRRLFYVGLTRAQEEVHLTYSGWTQNQYGRRFDNGPSEFLAELRRRLQATR